MEKIIKEGKEVEVVLNEILEENNLTVDDVVYSSNQKKGKLFQGALFEVTVYPKKAIIEEAKEYLKTVVENLGLEVQFEVINKDGRTVIKMYSNNDPILIGKNGQTIKALETLVKQKIQNEIGTYYKINLDVSDYKDKIAKRLEWLAKKSAKEVQSTGAPVILDNMTSYERRIIHEALSKYENIKTESEGEEPNRHVVIKPM